MVLFAPVVGGVVRNSKAGFWRRFILNIFSVMSPGDPDPKDTSATVVVECCATVQSARSQIEPASVMVNSDDSATSRDADVSGVSSP